MSLKAFHVVFISVSKLLAVFCAVWCLREWQAGGGPGAAAGAIVSVAIGVALAIYGVSFYRKMGSLQ